MCNVHICSDYCKYLKAFRTLPNWNNNCNIKNRDTSFDHSWWIVVDCFFRSTDFILYMARKLKSPACGGLEGSTMVPLCWDGIWTGRTTLLLCYSKENGNIYDMKLGENRDRRGGERKEKRSEAYFCSSRVISKHDRKFGKLLLT